MSFFYHYSDCSLNMKLTLVLQNMDIQNKYWGIDNFVAI